MLRVLKIFELSILVLLVVSCDLEQLQETRTRTFKDFNAAANVIASGWLPDFLPVSAKAIREKHNIDYNRGIISFSFELKDTKEFPLTDEMSPKEACDVRPKWILRKENWFPQAIIDGDIISMQTNGFHFFQVGKEKKERISNDKIQKWYLAIHFKQGICYVWY